MNKGEAHLTWSLGLLAEILVLGTGARLERIDPSVLALLKKKGIAVEVQDTVKCTRFFRQTEGYLQMNCASPVLVSLTCFAAQRMCDV